MTRKKPSKHKNKPHSIEQYYKSGLFTHFYGSAGYLGEDCPRWKYKLGDFSSSESSSDLPVFDLASLTKPLVTSVLSWHFGLTKKTNAEILCVYPWLAPLLSSYPDSKSFVMDLLEHTACLPAWHNFWVCYTQANLTPGDSEWSRRISEGILRAFNFRKRSEDRTVYSDVGYILLGLLLVGETGKNLGALFHDFTLEQCGASKQNLGFNLSLPQFAFSPTGFCPLRNKMLRGEVHDENAYFLGGESGHAGLFSGPGSLEWYLRQIFEGHKKFSANYIDFLKIQHQNSSSDYPGGWQRGDISLLSKFINTDNGVWLHHFGFTGTSIFINLETKFYGIVLTNRVFSHRIPGKEIRHLRSLAYQLALSYQ